MSEAWFLASCILIAASLMRIPDISFRIPAQKILAGHMAPPSLRRPGG